MLIFAVGFFFSLFIFIMIVRRGGKDYTADLANLLPRNTVVYIALNNLEALLDTISSAEYTERWYENGAIEDLLEDNEKWEEWQKKKKKYGFLIPYDNELDFVNRWMGKQVIAAIINVENITRPGIIIASKTRIGFEEKMASFVLEHYPELNLSKRKYRDKTIVVYEGEKRKRGFSYVLFGRTVVLSIRSPEPRYLEKIIDTFHEPELGNMTTLPGVKESLFRKASREGLFCYTQLQKFPELFTSFRDEIRSKDIMRHDIAAFLFKPYDFGTLDLTIKKREIMLHLKLSAMDDVASTTETISSQPGVLTDIIPVEKENALFWLVSELRRDLLIHSVSLAYDEPEDEEEPDVEETILKNLLHSETMPQMIKIGTFVAGTGSDEEKQSSLVTGLIIDVNEPGKPVDTITSGITTLITHWLEKNPVPCEFSQLRTGQQLEGQWLLWTKFPFPTVGFYESRIVVFFPPDNFTIISKGLKPDEASKSIDRLIPETLVQSLSSSPVAIHAAGFINLRKIGDTVQLISSMQSYFSDDKDTASREWLWLKFIQGFDSFSFITVTNQENEFETCVMLESSKR